MYTSKSIIEFSESTNIQNVKNVKPSLKSASVTFEHQNANMIFASLLVGWSGGMTPASGAASPELNCWNCAVFGTIALLLGRAQVDTHILLMQNSPHAKESKPMEFEPRRGEPIGLAVRCRNHSAKVSLM